MDEKKLRSFAQQKLNEIYESPDFDFLYERLSGIEKDLQRISKEIFMKEWICARMAFAAICWQRGTETQGLQSAQIKIFLRLVTESFQSPKMLELAAGFSEYYYAMDLAGEAVPSIAVTKRFLERLQLGKIETDGPQRPILMKQLIEILESLRASFGNDFFETIEGSSSGELK